MATKRNRRKLRHRKTNSKKMRGGSEDRSADEPLSIKLDPCFGLGQYWEHFKKTLSF